MAWASVWWQRTQVTELTAQKAALDADIAEMQVNAAARPGGRHGARDVTKRALPAFPASPTTERRSPVALEAPPIM
jgi:hypothetical protein